ncbi:MAG: putative hemin binding protein [uncultured marine phage]|uniref:Putative hemin binding protein n=1 Tax=uncultured marine phage TaxID=707152 RepID=A0A8D9C8P8_9VIRU|nr:MAG: putative hemin binding protein [uncultured marine phage]
MKKFLFLFLLLSPLLMFSQTTTTVSDGNWSNSANWDNGVPNNNDNAIINHNITLDMDDKVTSVVINDTLTNGGFKLTIRESFTNNGHFEDNSGVVRFRNDGPDKNIYGIVHFNRLNMNTNDSVFTNDTIYINRRLNINNGVLDVTGGILILKNDSINTGRMGRSTSGEIVGDFIWQKWVDRCNLWSIYSSPFDATLVDIQSASPTQMITTGFPNSSYPSFSWVNTYFYDNSLGYTTPDGLDVLSRGNGYWYWNSDTVYGGGGGPILQEWLIEVKGSMDLTTTFDFNVQHNGSDGWNLLGNPYPGTIDWDLSGWTKTNVNDAIYVMNTCTGIYSTYIGGIGTNGGTKYISSGQGFWIEADVSPTLTCTQNVLTNNNANLKNSLPNNLLRIHLGDDEIVLNITDGATGIFDSSYDGKKFISETSRLYSFMVGDTNLTYSINSFDETVLSVPIGTKGSGTLHFDNTMYIGTYLVFLEDKHLDTWTDISNVIDYDFISTGLDDEYINDRFVIHFLDVTDVEENGNNLLSLYPNPTNNSVNISGDYEYIKVTNVIGEVVYENTYTKTVDLSQFDSGIYFFNIDGNIKKVIKK